MGSKFRQEKLLLLAAYLCLEGPTSRREVAELFWRDVPTEAKKPRNPRNQKGAARASGEPNYMNNLSVALRILKPTGLVGPHQDGIRATVACDAADVREHLRLGRLKEATEQYGGLFAAGISTKEISPSLEEWLNKTRESLALQVGQALLTLGEREAAKARFAEGGAHAARVHQVVDDSYWDDQTFYRAHRLLLAAENPLSGVVELRARAEGVPLEPSAETAQRKLLQQRIWIGRGKELAILQELGEGEWAWVRGVGKTALLRELQSRTRGKWLYLEAESSRLHLPMLQNLLGMAEGGEEGVYQGLLRRDYVLIDDWEQLDPATQQVLQRLHKSGFKKRMVLTGEGRAPLATEHIIELGPFSEDELSGFADVYALTQGEPIAAIATIQGIAPDLALEAHLVKRNPTEQRVYLALSLLDEPSSPLTEKTKLGVIAQSLNFESEAVSNALEGLVSAGLVEPGGRVRGRKAALQYLDENFGLLRHHAVALAHHLPPQDALALYRKVKGLIDAKDRPRVREKYAEYARELMRRGFPKQAADELEDAPESAEITLLKARALERAGLNREALQVISGAAPSPELLAVKASVLYEIGLHEAAREALAAIGDSSWEVEAEKETILGKLALRKGHPVDDPQSLREAARHFNNAAHLWRACDNKERWVGAQTNEAIANFTGGFVDVDAFEKPLESAGDNPRLRARVLLNLATAFSRKGQHTQAAEVAVQAVELARNAEAIGILAEALNTAGTCYEHLDQPQAAREAYRESLELATRLGHYKLIGLNLAFLAVMERNVDIGKRALDRLRAGGYEERANSIEAYFKGFMGSSWP